MKLVTVEETSTMAPIPLLSEKYLQDIIEQQLGPREPPIHVFVTAVIMYSIILLCGLSANAFVIGMSMAHSKKLSISDWYLLSLAVSDLVLLVLGLPFELRDASTEWYPYPYPDSICRSRAFLTEMTSSISALIIAAFSIQRYLAICFPLRVQSIANPIRRTLKIISLVWITGFIVAFPCLFVVKVNVLWVSLADLAAAAVNDAAAADGQIADGQNNRTIKMSLEYRIPLRDSEYCYFDESRPGVSTVYVYFSFWISFLLPLLLIIFLYIRIVMSIQSACALHANNTRSQHELSKRKSAVTMSIAVASSFFICWLPFHLQRLLAVHVSAESQNVQIQNLQTLLFYISGYFYYGNSVMNPVLYTLLTRRMRRALFNILCKRKGVTSTASALSLTLFSRQYSRSSLSGVTMKDTRLTCSRKSSPMSPARPMVKHIHQSSVSYGTDGYVSRKVSPSIFPMLRVPSMDSSSPERQRSHTSPTSMPALPSRRYNRT